MKVPDAACRIDVRAHRRAARRTGATGIAIRRSHSARPSSGASTSRCPSSSRAVVTMVTNTVPLLHDKGLSAATASKIFGSFGLSLIAGRDRRRLPGRPARGRRASPPLRSRCPRWDVCCWRSPAAATPTLLIVAVFLIGIGAGAEFDVAAFLVARYLRHARLWPLVRRAPRAHHGCIGARAVAVRHALQGDRFVRVRCSRCAAPAFLVGAMMLLPLGRYPRFELRSIR